jgi:hypothetical protein
MNVLCTFSTHLSPANFLLLLYYTFASCQQMLLNLLESSFERTVRQNTGLMTYLLQVERWCRVAPRLLVHLLRNRFSTKAPGSSFTLCSLRKHFLTISKNFQFCENFEKRINSRLIRNFQRQNQSQLNLKDSIESTENNVV